MWIFAKNYLVSPQPVVAESLQWFVSWKARCDGTSIMQLCCNFENTGFRTAVVCAAVIDLLRAVHVA